MLHRRSNVFPEVIRQQRHQITVRNGYIATLLLTSVAGQAKMKSLVLIYNGPRELPRNFTELLQWRHNGRDSVSNHQPYDCLLNRLFSRRSKKTPKLRVIGLCAGNSPVTGEFPAQRASNAENVSIWWRHHVSPKWHYIRRIMLIWRE